MFFFIIIGFNKIKVSPHPGQLKMIKASMPHLKGRISVNYQIRNGKLKGEITLPKGLSGEWNYKGKTIELKAGKNLIK